MQTKNNKKPPKPTSKKIWSFQPSILSQTVQLRGAVLSAKYFSLHVTSFKMQCK